MDACADGVSSNGMDLWLWITVRGTGLARQWGRRHRVV